MVDEILNGNQSNKKNGTHEDTTTTTPAAAANTDVDVKTPITSATNDTDSQQKKKSKSTKKRKLEDADSQQSSKAKKAKGDNKEEGENKEETATPYPAFCRSYKVIQECTFDKIKLREFDTMCCDGAAVIEGFPDSSGNMVSVTTANYIIREMNLPLVGDIVSKYFTPLTVVSQGIPSHGARIYGNDKLVVFVSEYDVQDAEIQNSLVDAIYDFARRHRASMIISADGLVEDPTKEHKPGEQLQIGITGPGVGGGIDDEDDNEESESHIMLLGDDEDGEDGEQVPQSKDDLIKLLSNATKTQQEYKGQLWFCTNDEDFSNRMLELGHKPVKNLAVKHITGGILAESVVRGITVACLFAPLDKHLQIGTRACISLIHCIDTLLSKRTGAKVIDTANIEKTAKEIEQKLEQVINKLGGIGAESKSGYHHSMYM